MSKLSEFTWVKSSDSDKVAEIAVPFEDAVR